LVIFNIFLYLCQLAFAIILLCLKYIESIYYYNLNTYAHNKIFSAITDLEPIYEKDGFKYLSVKFEKNISYSSRNDSDYSNEWVYNYFIFISDTICPITDILLKIEEIVI